MFKVPVLWQYLKDSIDQIVAFFKSSPTISQTLAIETAAAVQVYSTFICKILIPMIRYLILPYFFNL